MSLGKVFPGGASGKELTCQHETEVRSLGWEDSLEEGTTTHSSLVTWRIPWTEEPGSLWSIGLERVRHDWSNLAHTHPRKIYKIKKYIFLLPIQGEKNPVLLHPVFLSCELPLVRTQNTSLPTLPNEWKFFPTIILCDTCWESKNLTQFLYKIHGDRVRFHTLRAQSQNTAYLSRCSHCSLNPA